jgi:hypothetical protein
MDDETINRYIASLTEQLIAAASQISALRASVNVLRVSVATQMNPDDPFLALRLFRALEAKALDSDPQEQELKAASEMIEAAKLWKKHGKHEA